MTKVKLLLVDDLEENLYSLTALLRRDDLEILQARSGVQALELALANDFALALVDVQMPEMDGFELAELMRGSERTRQIPIVFVTAGSHDTRRLFQGYDAGAVDFLWKPIDPRILKHKVDTFVELYRQRQAVAESLRLNEELMAVVSHDLRNSVNVVLFASQLLEADEDASRQELGQRLRKSGDRMTQIISDLFDLTRARLAGGIPVERQPMDLVPLLHQIVDELAPQLKAHRIVIHAPSVLRGSWDQSRLGQVLSNLLGNAIRHGDPSAPIEVHATALPDAVTIEIVNRGVIPSELVPVLFQPFRRGRDRTREGLGLGLYIVEQIIKAHGGRIAVSSDPGTERTSFFIELPLA